MSHSASLLPRINKSSVLRSLYHGDHDDNGDGKDEDDGDNNGDDGYGKDDNGYGDGEGLKC